MNDGRRELFESYRLHAELTNSSSVRRELANRNYSGLIAAVIVVTAAVLRIADEPNQHSVILFVSALVVSVLSATWAIELESYRQINKAKFILLHEIEKQLVYPFFKKEWDLQETRPYRFLRAAALRIPWLFVLLSLGTVGWVIYSWC